MATHPSAICAPNLCSVTAVAYSIFGLIRHQIPSPNWIAKSRISVCVPANVVNCCSNFFASDSRWSDSPGSSDMGIIRGVFCLKSIKG